MKFQVLQDITGFFKGQGLVLKVSHENLWNSRFSRTTQTRFSRTIHVIPGFLYNKDNSRTVPGFEGFLGLSMKFKVFQNNIDNSRAVPGFKCFLGVWKSKVFQGTLDNFPGLSMKFKVFQNYTDNSRAVSGFDRFPGLSLKPGFPEKHKTIQGQFQVSKILQDNTDSSRTKPLVFVRFPGLYMKF